MAQHYITSGVANTNFNKETHGLLPLTADAADLNNSLIFRHVLKHQVRQ